MADTNTGGGQTTGTNTAAKGGDHDRVAMLSVKADGSPDQLNPEFIIDKDAAKQATTEQFKQQAVSAADVELRGASTSGTGTTVADAPQDPSIKKIEQAHNKAAKQAESDAGKAVDALTK